MIWIIVLSVLALYIVFVLCLLIIVSQTDERKETLFISLPSDSRDNYVSSTSSVRVTWEETPEALIQPQERSSAAAGGR